MRIDSCTKDEVIQYMLNALGNVIYTGILIRGMTRMYFRILRMIVDPLVTVVLSMLRTLTKPPRIGRIQ